MSNIITRRDALTLGASAAALAVTGANAQTSNVKVIMATNRADTLDPAFYQEMQNHRGDRSSMQRLSVLQIGMGEARMDEMV